MRQILVLVLLVPCFVSFGQPYFQKTYDFAGGQDEGYDILNDGSDYILYGSGYDTLGKASIRFVKVDSTGNVLLKKLYTSKYGLSGGVNAIKHGDSIITGGYIYTKNQSDDIVGVASLFVMSEEGDSLNHVIYYGDSSDFNMFECVASTPDSGLIAVGYKYFLPLGPMQMILVKYDKHLSVEWMKSVAPGGGYSGVNRVTVLGNRIYVGGYVQNKSRLPLERYYTNVRKYSLDGTLLINKNYDGQHGSGGAFVYSNRKSLFLTTFLDSSNSNPNPQLYSYMAKLDSNLNVVWKTVRKIPKAMVNFEPIEQVDGSIVVAGVYQEREFAVYNKAQGYLAKYDSLGNVLWERVYTGPQWLNSSGFETCHVGDSAIYAIGSCFTGNSKGQIGIDMWLVKTDSNGCISPTTCTDISLAEDKTEKTIELQVYPQPASRLLKIGLQPYEGVRVQNLVITSVGGKSMLRWDLVKNHEGYLEVDVENWPRGIYFLSVTLLDGQVMTRKILVE